MSTASVARHRASRRRGSRRHPARHKRFIRTEVVIASFALTEPGAGSRRFIVNAPLAGPDRRLPVRASASRRNADRCAADEATRARRRPQVSHRRGPPERPERREAVLQRMAGQVADKAVQVHGTGYVRGAGRTNLPRGPAAAPVRVHQRDPAPNHRRPPGQVRAEQKRQQGRGRPSGARPSVLRIKYYTLCFLHAAAMMVSFDGSGRAVSVLEPLAVSTDRATRPPSQKGRSMTTPTTRSLRRPVRLSMSAVAA